MALERGSGGQEVDMIRIERSGGEIMQRGLLREHGVPERRRPVLVERDGERALGVIDDQDRTFGRMLLEMGQDMPIRLIPGTPVTVETRET